ncbi:MAG: hypothetical protein IJS54_03345 [Desulfovibrio sp.]|nr:hypothetical protein [Desulfovibrio sp.]
MDGQKNLEIVVHMVPGDTTTTIPYVKTVWQLCKALGLAEESALVAREGKLLTLDRHINPNDHLEIIKVTSRG